MLPTVHNTASIKSAIDSMKMGWICEKNYQMHECIFFHHLWTQNLPLDYDRYDDGAGA